MPATRRQFIKTGVTALSAATMLPQTMNEWENELKEEKEGLRILFQGDSITDGNRGRDNDPNHIMGHGYAYSIASRMGAAFPDKKFHFFNRGVSGNTIADMEKRWETDTLSLQPDVLSLLIGINDTDAVVQGKQNIDINNFGGRYESLVRSTVERNPGIRIMLCEPFVLPVGRVGDQWNAYKQDVESKQAVIRNIAAKTGAMFVPLQQVFNDACKKAEAAYWIWDGIHPTYSGHDLITRAWLEALGRHWKFLKSLRC